MAIIGESGSGKSVSALSVLRLVPYPPGLIMDGKILFHGQDLMTLGDGEMQALRGNRISMIFQEPSTALNPLSGTRTAPKQTRGRKRFPCCARLGSQTQNNGRKSIPTSSPVECSSGP